MSNAVLQCPRCGAGMVSSQRGGIALEECRACRGVFLGRGDMERLLVRGSGGPMVNGPAYEGRHRRD